MFPTIRGCGVFPGEYASVRNQNVESRDFLLDLITEFVYGLKFGEVDKTELDVLMTGSRLDIYSPCLISSLQVAQRRRADLQLLSYP